MHATFSSLPLYLTLTLSLPKNRKQYVHVRITNKLFTFIAAKDLRALELGPTVFLYTRSN